MVASPWPAACPSIDAGFAEAWPKLGAQQKMIEAKASIALPAVPQVMPKRIDAILAVKFADRVRPSLLEQPRIGGPALRLDQRIIVPGLGGIGGRPAATTCARAPKAV